MRGLTVDGNGIANYNKQLVSWLLPKSSTLLSILKTAVKSNNKLLFEGHMLNLLLMS